MERRTLLANVIGTVGIAAISGCLGGSDGGAEDTGEEETLAPMTDEETTADDSEESDDTENADDSTATSTDDGSTDETETATTTEEPATIEFDAEVENISKCGKTCRELTYALINRGQKDASDVTVNIKIFTGGDNIWDNDQNVGELGARSKRSGISREIDVGLSGGSKIKSNDGEIEIVLTPSSDGVSETFRFDAVIDV